MLQGPVQYLNNRPAPALREQGGEDDGKLVLAAAASCGRVGINREPRILDI